jgi:hypothetical protein
MQRLVSFFASMSAVLILGCDAKAPLELPNDPSEPSLAKGGSGGGGGTEFATRIALPSLGKGVHGEAYAINRAGTLIGGYSWDRAGYMHPVTWSQSSGMWQITAYPWDATATSAVIRGVNDQGDKGGTFWPGSAPRPVIWHAAGGFTVLGCNEGGEVRAMSAGAQVVVGTYRGEGGSSPAIWAPGQCLETLPPLVAGSWGAAYAVNSDGTIVGGSSGGFPVRWRRAGGAWSVEQLDARSGTAHGSNSAGDLVGTVQVACSAPNGCSEGHIWYVTGGGLTLPTLGGSSTAPRAVNAAREVAGLSTLADGSGVPFIWSETTGIRQLPARQGGWAFAISDVRGDGTRVVAGAGGGAQLWVVRNP